MVVIHYQMTWNSPSNEMWWKSSRNSKLWATFMKAHDEGLSRWIRPHDEEARLFHGSPSSDIVTKSGCHVILFQLPERTVTSFRSSWSDLLPEATQIYVATHYFIVLQATDSQTRKYDFLLLGFLYCIQNAQSSTTITQIRISCNG